MEDHIVQLLAKEGNGAVEVDESPKVCPPVVVLIGPIKIWWKEGMWDSPQHIEYTEWRDAVRVALVKSGCAVYSPHRAIQGRWNEKLQAINDMAVAQADLVVVLTPPDIEANGTAGEVAVAVKYQVETYDCPPGDHNDIEALLIKIDDFI